MGKKGKANVQILGIKKKETNKEKVRRRSEDKKVKLVSHPSLSSAQYVSLHSYKWIHSGRLLFLFVVQTRCTHTLHL